VIIKALIVSLSLISWTPEIDVSGSVGFAQKYFTADTWHNLGKSGAQFSIAGDYFFTKILGFGAETGFSILSEGDFYPQQHNS